LLKSHIKLAPKAGMSAGASFRSQSQMVGAIFEGSDPRPPKGESTRFVARQKFKSEPAVGIYEIADLRDSSFSLGWAWA
jgi:hypothetical protein